MSIGPKIATVFGGSGFVGRYVVQALARAGYTVKVASRAAESAYFLRPYGSVGQIVSMTCNVRDRASVERAIAGSSVVVNCIGILYERKRGDFKRLHTDLPQMIAEICAAQNVSRFVHISALGADRNPSRYSRTKLAGEQAVLAAFPNATILRPSVIFGPEDDFFNRFATMAGFMPALPLIGGGMTRFQPVYVRDVADAVIAAATHSAFGHSGALGQVFELGGPEVLNFRDIYSRLFSYIGKRCGMVNLPFGLASLQAGILQFIPPKPILTPDQVKSLKTDNVVQDDAMTLDDLGVTATGMSLIVPVYLERFRPGGRFGDKKRA